MVPSSHTVSDQVRLGLTSLHLLNGHACVLLLPNIDRRIRIVAALLHEGARLAIRAGGVFGRVGADVVGVEGFC